MSGSYIAWMLILVSAGVGATTQSETPGNAAKLNSETATASEDKCSNNWTIKLETKDLPSDKTIKEDGLSFPPGKYITRVVEGKVTYFGCLCDVVKCIRKCCPDGENLVEPKTCAKRQNKETEFVVSVRNSATNVASSVDIKRTFRLVHGLGSNELLIPIPSTYNLHDFHELTSDGKLKTSDSNNEMYGFDDFCIDHFNEKNEHKVLVRGEPNGGNGAEVPAVNEGKGANEPKVKNKEKPTESTSVGKDEAPPSSSKKESNAIAQSKANAPSASEGVKDKQHVQNVTGKDKAPLSSSKNESKVIAHNEVNAPSASEGVMNVLHPVLWIIFMSRTIFV